MKSKKKPVINTLMKMKGEFTLAFFVDIKNKVL